MLGFNVTNHVDPNIVSFALTNGWEKDIGPMELERFGEEEDFLYCH